jgi:hypothetical protein
MNYCEVFNVTGIYNSKNEGDIKVKKLDNNNEIEEEIEDNEGQIN